MLCEGFDYFFFYTEYIRSIQYVYMLLERFGFLCIVRDLIICSYIYFVYRIYYLSGSVFYAL